jgi:hypothetical protein
MSARIFRISDYDLHRRGTAPPTEPATIIILPVIRIERPLEQPRRRKMPPVIIGPLIKVPLREPTKS